MEVITSDRLEVCQRSGAGKKNIWVHTTLIWKRTVHSCWIEIGRFDSKNLNLSITCLLFPSTHFCFVQMFIIKHVKGNTYVPDKILNHCSKDTSAVSPKSLSSKKSFQKVRKTLNKVLHCFFPPRIICPPINLSNSII